MSKTRELNATDGYVTQYIDLSTNTQFGTLDVPAHFDSEVDYTVNHIYEIMTTAQINNWTQLCELEHTQIFTIMSLA